MSFSVQREVKMWILKFPSISAAINAFLPRLPYLYSGMLRLVHNTEWGADFPRFRKSIGFQMKAVRTLVDSN